MGDFKLLTVWQHAHRLVLDTYRLTVRFPTSERYGLVAQMRRAAVSISANIAESRGRFGKRDEGHFLQIALGSSRELECLFLATRDLGLVTPADAEQIAAKVDEVQRMLYSMIEYGRSEHR